ncbi:DUF5819 family protein [Metasolibacillus meyeri]|uniref:DUF5819 family protein n=1 Tax=Metasolibacillus meyeri TaxID=1071052 RepID=UPI000D2FA3D5|nr:DUF5819 family protein [Metasolibacillus meyeri]
MWKKIAAIFLCLGFIFHFTVTLIYNTPSNPIKAKYNQQINFYMEPLFTQNWKLFAPTPVSTNSQFYVKAKIQSADGVTTTGWLDMLDYMVENNQANRFTPYNRLLRIPRSAYSLRLERDETIQKIISKVHEGKLDQEKYEKLIVNEEKDAQVEMSNKLVNRFAEAHLKSAYPDSDILEFKVLLVETSPVPFSKNGVSDVEIDKQYVEFDWEKPQNIVSMF